MNEQNMFIIVARGTMNSLSGYRIRYAPPRYMRSDKSGMNKMFAGTDRREISPKFSQISGRRLTHTKLVIKTVCAKDMTAEMSFFMCGIFPLSHSFSPL